MAVKYSDKQLKIALINFYGRFAVYKYLTFLKIYKKVLIKLKNFYSSFKIQFLKKNFVQKNKKLSILKINLSTDLNYDELKNQFSNNNYCFVENFFPEDVYTSLKNNFPPPDFYLEPENPLKNYKMGFNYSAINKKKYDEKKGIKYMELFPVLEQIYDFIKNSSELKNFVNNVTANEDYQNCNLLTTYSTEGSYLIPHIDTVINSDDFKNVVNFIYFVDGGEVPEYSGATGIYKDNEFNIPLLIPKSLKNSVLIYDTKKPYFHGFKIMKKNMFRKAIIFSFMKKS
jgi:hypothetical protein